VNAHSIHTLQKSHLILAQLPPSAIKILKPDAPAIFHKKKSQQVRMEATSRQRSTPPPPSPSPSSTLHSPLQKKNPEHGERNLQSTNSATIHNSQRDGAGHGEYYPMFEDTRNGSPRYSKLQYVCSLAIAPETIFTVQKS
jgi:hypothetical protein